MCIMVLRKNTLFVDLFSQFLEVNEDVVAIIVSDAEGLIIAGEKRKDIDMELVSVLTSIINPVLERMRSEFAFKKFGNATFDTEDHRLLFISVDEERIYLCGACREPMDIPFKGSPSPVPTGKGLNGG